MIEEICMPSSEAESEIDSLPINIYIFPQFKFFKIFPDTGHNCQIPRLEKLVSFLQVFTNFQSLWEPLPKSQHGFQITKATDCPRI